MSVHTCQCRCVPHVEDHCRNGEPDFPPEVIEKAARAVADTEKPCRKALDANPTGGCWMDTGHCYCVQAARAVLAAVADDLRAEGVTQKHGPCICNTGPGTDGPDEFCPHHGRTYAEVLAGWERDYALAKSGFDAEARAAREAEAEREAAYQRGMVEGARQVIEALEDTWGPVGLHYVDAAREAVARIEKGAGA